MAVPGGRADITNVDADFRLDIAMNVFQAGLACAANQKLMCYHY
jgi:hypothetical protein